MGEPLSTNLIERYLCTRARRYFRGRHDGEFFFVLNTELRLHVHLEIPPMHPDVFTIRVTPACFFPITEQARLTALADAWNEQHRDVTAVVHGSSDPHRIGVMAEQSRWIGERVRFDELAAFADRATAAAIDLFSRVTVAAELPPGPLLQDAS
ncbi:immunoglobulin domain-containing family protein [Mycobacterium sp. ML4]